MKQEEVWRRKQGIQETHPPYSERLKQRVRLRRTASWSPLLPCFVFHTHKAWKKVAESQRNWPAASETLALISPEANGQRLVDARRNLKVNCKSEREWRRGEIGKGRSVGRDLLIFQLAAYSKFLVQVHGHNAVTGHSAVDYSLIGWTFSGQDNSKRGRPQGEHPSPPPDARPVNEACLFELIPHFEHLQFCHVLIKANSHVNNIHRQSIGFLGLP